MASPVDPRSPSNATAPTVVENAPLAGVRKPLIVLLIVVVLICR